MHVLLFTLILSDPFKPEYRLSYRENSPSLYFSTFSEYIGKAFIELSFNKNFIAYYRLKDDVIVSASFRFFQEYQRTLIQLAFQNIYTEELRKQEVLRGGVGLVPTIDLPIQFPAPVAGIIGQGGQLNISGSQRIEFGGSQLQNLDLRETEYTHRSWFPQLEMEQRLAVNLRGTIGEKVNVFIDHNSERQFSLDNTIRLEYVGDEDEIIQSIRAGNTDLSLPGIILIGGSTPHKGLFGIKSEAKVGPLNLTTIASREEVENESRQWRGGGTTEREIKIESYDFVKSRFFVLLPPKYIRSLVNPNDITSGDINLLPKTITDFNVYQGGTYVAREQEVKSGTAFDIPIANYQLPDYESQQFPFIRKENAENDFFFLDTVGISSSHKFTLLELNYSLSQYDILAVRWTYRDWYDNIDTIGTLSVGDTLKGGQIIKRERTEGESDTSHISWWYELKHIYSLGATGIDMQGFDLKVFRHSEGEREPLEIDISTGKEYAQLLGLKVGGNVATNIFDQARGLIIFPNLFPFLDSSLSVQDSIYHIPKWKPEYQNKYYIWAKYRGTTRTYTLGMFGVMEGSEVVKIGGVTLERGKDYQIDYNTGEIRFLTALADNPNADITVDFQYLPFFQPSAKNLLAMRGETKLGEHGQISSALMYYSTSSLDIRPRLGSEPKKILLAETVGSWSVQPEFLTTAVDKLPFIQTEATSLFSISGNAGFSKPDPNIKNEVYIDDFEGVKSATSLGINRRDWSFGSLPSGMMDDNFAQVMWYNLRDGIEAKELYPDLPSHKQREKRTVLQIKKRDENWASVSGRPFYWSSLLTCISQSGYDFSESEYLEVWVKGGSGKLHIDIGTDIPEDGMRRGADGQLKGRGVLDTEDKNRNRYLDIGEDTGLDGVAGEDGKNVPGDEGNDDYHYDINNPDDYLKINGTEVNGFLDTEDSDGNGILNTGEWYFTMTIDLDNPHTDPHKVLKRTNGWMLFRIPIVNFQKVNSAQWESIKFARLWVEGITKGNILSIASMDIVGNHWKHFGSKAVKLRVKNTEEDLDYIPPPIELRRDALGRLEKEQSLVLEYDDLYNAEGGGYTAYSVARNFMDYKELSFWLKGHSLSNKEQFFIRLSSNVTNFYEYRVNPGVEWQEISIDLEKLAQRKLNKEKGDTIYYEGDSIIIKGRPSLTNITRIEVGITCSDSMPLVSGEVWVNELRLISPRRDIGHATNVTVSSRFADLANLTLSYGRRNPYFKSLGTFMASSAPATNSQISTNFTSSVSLNKFLPTEWGINLPLNFGISESESKPKYQTGSDIILTEVEAEKHTSDAYQKNVGLNFSKARSRNPLLNLSLDNIRASYNHRNAYSSSYTRIDTALSEQASLSYGYSPTLPSIKVGKMEFRYYPETINANISRSYTRDRNYLVTEYDSMITDTTQLPDPFREPIPDHLYIVDTTIQHITDTMLIARMPIKGLNYGYGGGYRPINPLQLGYSISFTKDLAIPDTLRKDKETGLTEQGNITFSPTFFGYLSPSIRYSASYQENHNIQLDTMRNVGTSNTLSFGLPVNMGKFTRIITSLRDETQDSTVVRLSPRWMLISFENIMNRFRILQLSHSISRSNQFYDLFERPDYNYRVGIRETPDVMRLPNSQNISQITRSYGLQSLGLSIANISITTGASFSTSEGGRIGSKTISERFSYPDALISVSGIERYIKRFSSASVGINYSSDMTKSGQRIADFVRFTNFSNTSTLGWNFQSRFQNGVRASFNTRFTSGRNETTGETGIISETQNANYTLSASHSFKPPEGFRLPFVTDPKVSNTVDGTLTASFSTDKAKNLTTDTEIRDSRSLNITPQISYNFSSSVGGGANATFSQQWNKIGGGGNTRNVGLKFFVEFMF